jgi:hypothetical protein
MPLGVTKRGCFLVTNESNLANSLWSIFRDEIATGEPVFFCFSQETLKDELAAIGLGSTSPLLDICAQARSCFEIDGNHVTLKPEALTAADNGVSQAIILVCQQILAVEEMVRIGDQYSEQAYFPRLRALMAPELPRTSSNPFRRFGEFEAIWKCFAREVGEMAGATEDSITFAFGAYSGVNKARFFPLSQALFSRADLQILLENCRANRLRSDSRRDVWTEIWRERNHLTRRGRLLVKTAFLQDRLIEQVQRFAGRATSTSNALATAARNREAKLELAVTCDMVDWCTEQYVGFLISKDSSGTHVTDEGLLAVKIRAVLAERQYCFLALAESKDHWRHFTGTVEVPSGQTMLLLGKRTGVFRGRAALDGLTPPIAVSEASVQPFSSKSNVYICPVELPKNARLSLSVCNGRIATGEPNRGQREMYEWIGGVCVDARQRKFLREALPEAIRFDGDEFLMDSIARVGSFPMSCAGFQSIVAKLECDSSYEISFRNGRRAQLSIAVQKLSQSERVGFRMSEQGFLSPSLAPVTTSECALVGYAESFGQPARPPTSISEIAHLLRKLKREGFKPSAVADWHSRLDDINASPAPDGVKRLLLSLIHRV